MARPARAILIGIDEYPEDFPTLDSAVQDATAMENLLKNDLGMTEGITLLTNSKATRSQIVDTILSLEQDKSLKRGEPILIFFSGLAANGAPEGSAETVKIGSICPADVDKAGGISDEALLQLLDRVVRTCGNNIVSRHYQVAFTRRHSNSPSMRLYS
ncbi:hypothetical protein BDN72DRAFT_74140 [Pluteus cervinus]|uniref:Uncharacterized protein n=1 Tax=Pluteus cervinus TaxID=181527 RepID=A0ACD3AQ02_9AGAR|nr:hypothetical protein BDN72DRAFT_74140 [Pluteus cervinus]